MKNWNELIVSENTTIKEVMSLFEQKNSQIALVADNFSKLLGVVTDGDMRRSILRDVSVTDPITKAMNSSPCCVFEDQSPEEAQIKFNLLDVNYLPIISRNKILVGLFSRKDFTKFNKNVTPVVIMAGGEGLRLRPITENIPKPLVPINGVPIMEKLIINMANQGFTNFYLAINYLGEMIQEYFGDGKKWGVNIKYISENQKLGTAGALFFLKDINTDVLILNGDLVTNVNFNLLLENHQQHNSYITIGVQKMLFRIPYGVVNCDDINVISLQEKPLLSYNANCGIYAFSKKVFKEFSTEDQIDMPCLINRLLDNNKKVNVFPIYEDWHDIGNIRDLEKISFIA